MAVRSKSEFESLYGTTGSVFADNSSGDITAEDQRNFGQDIADSFNINEGIKSGTASGTDTYTVSITGVSAYADGDTYAVKFTNANTGASTININTLGVKALKKSVSTALASGDIASGQSFIIYYDGTNFQVQGLSTAGTISDSVFGTGWNGDTTTGASKNTIYDLVAGLQTKIISLGDWNMDSTLNIDITHGVTAKNIRSIDVIIRDDSDENYDKLEFGATGTGELQGWIEFIRTSGSTTQLRLRRLTGGYFDTTAYDSTSYNRGWITIQYVA